MSTLYYTKYNTFEILDGGDNMFMIEGNIVDSIEKAKRVCNFIETQKIRKQRSSQHELWYCSVK